MIHDAVAIDAAAFAVTEAVIFFGVVFTVAALVRFVDRGGLAELSRGGEV